MKDYTGLGASLRNKQLSLASVTPTLHGMLAVQQSSPREYHAIIPVGSVRTAGMFFPHSPTLHNFVHLYFVYTRLPLFVMTVYV